MAVVKTAVDAWIRAELTEFLEQPIVIVHAANSVTNSCK